MQKNYFQSQLKQTLELFIYFLGKSKFPLRGLHQFFICLYLSGAEKLTLKSTLKKKLSATLLMKCAQGRYGRLLGHAATPIPLGKYLIFSLAKTRQNLINNLFY